MFRSTEPSLTAPSRIKALGFFGALAPPVYAIATIVGGLLWPGYSQYYDTVSTLTGNPAPNLVVMIPLFAVYNLLVISLAWGLHLFVFRVQRRPSTAPALLAFAGLLGLVLFFFPQDNPQGPPTTLTGTVHVGIAGVIALLSLATIALFWRYSRDDKGLESYSRFSLVILILAVPLGAFGAISVNAPYAGVAERLSIGTILLWMEVLSLGLMRKSKSSIPN